MATRDPMFAPRLSDAEVTRLCRDAAAIGGGRELTDVVAHAIVARRMTVVADLDVIDGPIGRFVRTGEVPVLPAPRLWWPLYGPMYGVLPDGAAVQAVVLSEYLAAHVGRGPVDGWPCADQFELTRKD